MLELSVLYQKFYPKLVYLLLSSRGSLLDLQIRKLFSYINQHPNSEPPFFTCFFKWESAKSTVSFFFLCIYILLQIICSPKMTSLYFWLLIIPCVLVDARKLISKEACNREKWGYTTYGCK